ncbi:MAG: hypothetical protein ACP5I8_06070 [Phycisphaerae bacterium]
MLNAGKHQKILLWVGLFLAIVLDTGVQICWRVAVPQHGGMLQTLGLTLINPFFLLSILLHVWQLFNWMMVLALADLSFAQPITALSYISVAVCSEWLFSETLHPLQFFGMVLVLVGVVLVSRTSENTAGKTSALNKAAIAPSATGDRS